MKLVIGHFHLLKLYNFKLYNFSTVSELLHYINVDDVVGESYQKSLELLRNLATEAGFIAAFTDRANYGRVFSRDGVIAGLAALASQDEMLKMSFRNTIETLAKTQDDTGRIPSNVSIDTLDISYGKTVGRIDATLWFVVGSTQYYLATNDEEFHSAFMPRLEKALEYLACLELNGRGLVYIPPGADWADEYLINGYVLYDQLLYYLALRGMADITNNDKYRIRTEHLKDLLLVNYFPQTSKIDDELVYHQESYKHLANDHRPLLPISSFYTSSQIEGHIDNFANALMLLSGILNQDEADAMRQEINTRFLSISGSILPAFYPIINESSPHWQFLTQNFRFDFRNRPHEYHNGGRWPLVHGFYLSACPGDYAYEYLKQFAQRNQQEAYLFPEYYHGLTDEPGGVHHLGFSASAYVLAHQSIVNNQPVFR